ncbi:acyl carrier protein [Catenuloplanes atrovinosus]|uniref:Acyl carrier protein n=1 Tax=Catenuloplanes atrovinosus TaxID=137266 RepID=A0AAE3YN62_9ACTN|nr:acyl carrier protein [Catenuloplanes atrovinosus]MDR7275575.1 acyl carrier protein [Catenuloplanes atrovinosus]
MVPPNPGNPGPDRNEAEFERRLADAFRTGLDLPSGIDVTTLAFGQHRNWDSLGHMSLIVALEQEFGIRLVDDGVLDIDTYATAASAVRSELHRSA